MSPASRVRWFHAAAAVVVPVALLAGCGGSPRRNRAAGAVVPGAQVAPRACGQTAAAPGPRLQVFLADTVALEAEITASETALRNACSALGRGLGLARARTSGSTRVGCGAVAREIHDVQVRLDAATPPGAPAAAPAPAPASDARLDTALRALRAHLPAIARLREQAAGPHQTALHTWGRAAADLVAAGPAPLRPLGARAACMFDQLVIAAARLAPMQASLTTQLEAAAEIQAAARLPAG